MPLKAKNVKNPWSKAKEATIVDMGVWPLGICVDRIDESLSWTHIKELIKESILYTKRAKIVPLTENGGIFIGEY